jgi:hypothetical protein
MMGKDFPVRVGVGARKERVARATESAPSVSGKRKGETTADVPQYRALPFLPVVVPIDSTLLLLLARRECSVTTLKKKQKIVTGFFSDVHFRI